MKRIIKLIFLGALILTPWMVYGLVLDQPHHPQGSTSVNCGSCHWVTGGTAPWSGVTPPAGWQPQDITVNNLRCMACHNGTNPNIPQANIHSGSTTSTQYWSGTWTVECITCHNPHYQRQPRAWKTDPNLYLATGPFTVSGVGPYDSVNNRTPITPSSPLTEEYQGKYFMPDKNYPFFYKIISSTQNQNTFYVQGQVNTSYVRGGGFGIVYGMNIKDSITYTNPGGQTLTSSVKLFREGYNVPGGFIDTNNYSSSICQACHTQTANFTRTNQSHGTAINQGASCLNPAAGCHQEHPQSFAIAGAKCGVCHGVPPSYYNSSTDHNLVKKIKQGGVEYDTYTGVTTPGAHVKHTQTGQMTYSKRQVGCMECHNGGMQPQESDPTIGDYKIQIGINATTVGYTGGSYDGRTSLANTFTYQAVAPTTVTTNGSLACSNIYCHGSTIGGTVNPTWTGTVACGDCHKATAANPPTLGSHVKHAGDSSTMQSAIACSMCHGHSGTGSAAHVDGSATWSLNIGDPRFGSSATYRGTNAGSVNPVPSNTYGQCSNIYCHSNANPLGGTNQFSTVTWGGSPMACNSCHSGAGDASPTWSSSHTKHVNTYSANSNFTCNACHSEVASGNTTISDKTKHVNAQKNVAFNNINPSGSYSSPNCSNLYCHSNANPYGGTNQYTTVAWNGSAPCNSCHSGAGDATPTWSGPHTKHVNDYSANPAFTCNACHSATASNNNTISGYAVHVNTVKDVVFNTFSNASATYNIGTHQCSNTYCHSAGTGGTAHSGDSRPVASNTVTWSGSTTCGSCHGGGNATGMPNYANGSPKANSHAKHPADCSICHAATTSDGTTITDKTKHVNKLYDLQAKTGYTFNYTYQSTGGSCSSISCHFNGMATWGGVVSCGDCHAVPPPTGAHVVHFGGTSSEAQYGNDGKILSATAYKFNCGNCHPLNVANHANGTVEIELYNPSATGFKQYNPPSATKSGTGNSTVCDNVYCHSNGADGANRAYKSTPQWGSTFGANKCGGCHDNPPQYAGQGHYNSSGFMGKEGGHLVGIHFDNIYTGTTGLASAGTGNTNSHGNSLYSTTIACYICHSNVVSQTPVDTYALYNVSSSAMKCSNCHTGATPTPLQNGAIADKGLHINGTKEVAFVNAFSMKSKAQLRDESRPSMWTRNAGYKTPGAYDSATINSSDWNPGTKTCVTACHNNQPVTWGDTGVTCSSCHTDL